MLWGKKILEWTASPQEALDIMVELNNRYALDGQDPNSYSGIFWILGRYDRPWGPERPIFGTVRYMSSENTARKVRVGELHSTLLRRDYRLAPRQSMNIAVTGSTGLVGSALVPFLRTRGHHVLRIVRSDGDC